MVPHGGRVLMDWTHLAIIATYCLLSFFWAGCPCCGTGVCPIGTDTFTRADEDPVSPSAWEERSGADWAVVSNTLRTATSNALLKYLVEQPSSVSEHYVSVDVYGATGDQIRIIVDYVDDSNYHFVELTVGDPNGCLALYKRVAGSNTLLTKRRLVLPATTSRNIRVYFGDAGNGNSFACAGSSISGNQRTIEQHDGDDVYIYVPVGSGTFVGLGTGTIASTVRFDNFVYERHYGANTTCKRFIPTCQYQIDLGAAMPDGTDVGCGFSETAGSWSMASGWLTTTSTNAILLCETIHPRQIASARMTLSVNAPADAKVRFIFNYLDSDNYDFIEFTVEVLAGSDLTKGIAVRRAAGVETTLESNRQLLADLVDTSISSCLSNGHISYSNIGVAIGSIPTSKRWIGVGTGSSVGGGTVKFKDLRMFRGSSPDDLNTVSTSPACSHCDACNTCIDGTTRETVVLTIPTGTWTSTDLVMCPDCTSKEGVFAFDKAQSNSNCEWTKSIASCDLVNLYTITADDAFSKITLKNGLVVFDYTHGGQLSLDCDFDPPLTLTWDGVSAGAACQTSAGKTVSLST